MEIFPISHRLATIDHRIVALPALLVTFLTVILFDQAQALPCTPTFSSYHQNTQAGMDTTMNGLTYFTHYFERPTGTTYVFQLWTQPSTEGPSVYLFSPTATQSSRRLGLLSSYGQYFCRAVVLRET